MTTEELENLVRLALGLDPDAEIVPDEEWDSLDHLAIISRLQSVEGIEAGKMDLSGAISFSKLYELFRAE